MLDTIDLVAIIDRFSQAKVLVVGDLILDSYTHGRVERISPEAPVPVVLVTEDYHCPGGAGNVANNIKTLGGTPLPCGYIGNDEAGRNLAQDLITRGISTEGLWFTEGMQTIQKLRILAQRQQVVRIDRERPFTPSAEQLAGSMSYLESQLSACGAVIVSDYGKGAVNPQLLDWLRLRKEGPLRCIDPKEKNFPYYQDMDIITPNKSEAEKLAGIKIQSDSDLELVAHTIYEQLRPKHLLITLGELGMALFRGTQRLATIPTRARQVFDVSGAGDTVIAIYALASACGATPLQAAILANAGAGIVVAKLGTASLTAAELKEALHRTPETC